MKMDGTEDSSYLTLLNDGTHNYLLQTTEEALGVEDPSLNVEPMFTGIEDGSGAWSVSLPILMNGNLIPDADQELENPMHLPTQAYPLTPPHLNAVETAMGLPASLPELYEDSLQNRESVSLQEDTSEGNQMRYPIEIPGKGFKTADGLFIANDLLLQLKLGGEDLDLAEESSDVTTKIVDQPLAHVPEQESILMNPKTLVPHNGIIDKVNNIVEYEVSRTKQKCLNGQGNLFNENSNIHGNNLNLGNRCLENQEIFDVANLNATSDIIQLFNTDGTVINISKEQLLNYDPLKDQPISPGPDAKAKLQGETESVEDTAELFEIVMAHKCKRCPFLCEKQEDMMQHWKNEHLLVRQLQNGQSEEKVPIIKENNLKEPENKNGLIKCSNINGEVKIMKSILKNNDHQTVFLCSECNLGYGSTDKLKSHMIAAHKLAERLDEHQVVVNVKSSNKNLGGKSKMSLAQIQKQAKASKKIKCSVKGCDLRFSMDDMRIRHEKCHVEGQKKQFKCFECDAKFSIWRVCNKHMWKCHKIDLGLFTCPMCSVFKASSAVRLMTHMAIHEDEKPYLCSECGKTFKQQTQLRNHQVVHKKEEDVPEWAGQQQCDICKKYFANAKSLKKHVQSVHDKFKPFICNICGHKTARKAMLDLHLRQHTGEKPHKCPICEYKTGDHNSLRRHVMRHSGDTKYSCPHCRYTSIQSTSYKNHIASKHPGLGGSYFCSLCSYHTVNENTYLSHIGDHKNGLIKEICDTDDNNDELKKTMASLNEENFSFSDNRHNKKRKISKDVEDDETQNYLSLLDHSNDAVDTGGITIPAGFELQVPL